MLEALSVFFLKLTGEPLEKELADKLDEETLLKLYNNMSYEYATCPKDSHRHSSQALELAKQICEDTKHQNPNYLTTLAAAHAECGDFEEATRVAHKAIALTCKNSSREKSKLQEMLRAFKSKRPFRRR